MGTLELESVSYDGKDIGVKASRAAIDSGTSLIAAPTAIAEQINKLIGATHVAGPEYMVDCSTLDSLGDISFSFGGHEYKLSPNDYVLKVTELGQTICLDSWASIFRPSPTFGSLETSSWVATTPSSTTETKPSVLPNPSRRQSRSLMCGSTSNDQISLNYC